MKIGLVVVKPTFFNQCLLGRAAGESGFSQGSHSRGKQERSAEMPVNKRA